MSMIPLVGLLFPELSSCKEVGGVDLFTTTQFREGVLFESPSIDLEALDALTLWDQFKRLIQGIPDQTQIKIETSVFSSDEVPSSLFRSPSMQSLGFIKRR